MIDSIACDRVFVQLVCRCLAITVFQLNPVDTQGRYYGERNSKLYILVGWLVD